MIQFGRSAWGALPPNRPSGTMERCSAIVVHHSATQPPVDFDAAKAQTLAIQRDHLSRVDQNGKLTFSDIAYNLLVGPGCTLVGRGPMLNDGATDDDTSTDTVSVCVLGNYEQDEVSPKTFEALQEAVKLCRDVWGPLPVKPHRDYYQTGCPGSYLIERIPELNGAPDMDPDQYFKHQITLDDDDLQPTYDTDIEGWHAFVHGELKRQRFVLVEILEAIQALH